MKLILLSILLIGLWSPETSDNLTTSFICQGQEPVYSIRVLPLADQPGRGCYAMQLNIYGTYPNGQILLKHTATIQSGDECKGGLKVLKSTTFSAHSSPEYIVKDEQLNGYIEEFIARHENIYRQFVIEKERLMRLNGHIKP